MAHSDPKNVEARKKRMTNNNPMHNPEYAAKTAAKNKGKKSWNLGLTAKEHPNLKILGEKSSKTKKRNYINGDTVPWNKNKKMSKEYCDMVSKDQKNRIWYYNPETKQRKHIRLEQETPVGFIRGVKGKISKCIIPSKEELEKEYYLHGSFSSINIKYGIPYQAIKPLLIKLGIKILTKKETCRLVYKNNIEMTKLQAKKECEYCGKNVSLGNFAKYHGDKCKLKCNEF